MAMFRDFGRQNYNCSDPRGNPSISAPYYVAQGSSFPEVNRLRKSGQLAGKVICEAGVDEFEPNDPSQEHENNQELGGQIIVQEELPIKRYEKQIVDTIRDNPVTILTGQPGCGKSTQLPQFLYEAGFKQSYVTQPRRAAARNVAERVRDEMAARYPERDPFELVGFQTATERFGSDDAPIKIVTDGLQAAKELNDHGVQEHEVLVIDEAHERSVNIDVLLAYAKHSMATKPNQRVVVMSATMDSERLSNFFADETHGPAPIIEVEGRSFTIDRLEKPNSTVVKEVAAFAEEIVTIANGKAKIENPNGILVFVPGEGEIKDVMGELQQKLPPHVLKQATILPLYASQSPQEQQAALRRYPGVKIIVSTNVAETSITIEDIGVVVDSGWEREMRLEYENSGQWLHLHPASQANCDQRAGRAGRVTDGTYVLTRLNDRLPHTPYMQRSKFSTPEILRTDPVRTVLQFAGSGLDISKIRMVDTIKPSTVEHAKKSLRRLGALAIEGAISTMGRRMVELPVFVSSARMLVEADRYSDRTRHYVAAITAIKEMGGLPSFGPDSGKRWQELTEETESDFLAQLDIFIATQHMTLAELHGMDLNVRNVIRSREHYDKLIRRLKLRHEPLLPPTQDERTDVRRCIFAGLIDSIYKHEGHGQYVHLGGASNEPREISNRSVVLGKRSPSFIVGTPFLVEYFKRDGDDATPVTKRIIESVTVADSSDLVTIAPHLVERTSEGYTMRNNQFVEVIRQSFAGVRLGVTEEVPAEPSPRLRQSVIEFARRRPGSQQRYLHGIKRELEKLAQLSKDYVPQLTHDMIGELIQAATPENVTDPSIIERNLAQLITEQGIALDQFVSPERRERIRQDAPESLQIGEVTLKLQYKKGKVTAKHFRQSDLEQLTEDVFLPDGRQVYFLDRDGKRRSLIEIQAMLADNQVVALPEQVVVGL